MSSLYFAKKHIAALSNNFTECVGMSDSLKTLHGDLNRHISSLREVLLELEDVDSETSEQESVKICTSNATIWFKPGTNCRHRDPAVGPAFVSPEGLRKYYVDGMLHNPYGPAIEYPHFITEYWLHGKKYSYEEWKKKTGDLESERVRKKLAFKEARKTGNQESEGVENSGATCFYRHQRLHRDPKEGPAFVSPDGVLKYYVNGVLHNPYGPAVAGPADTPPAFYLNGTLYDYEEWERCRGFWID